MVEFDLLSFHWTVDLFVAWCLLINATTAEC